MKALCKQMLDKSVAAMLSAIEVYNKPDFKYREESFVILAVNSWELLFKAKILKDARNSQRSLYIYDGKRIRKSRSGNPMTIELLGCMRKLGIDTQISKNISSLVEVRDTAIHFFHNRSLKYVIYTLGVASLRNYQRLVNEWFDRSLLEYNFYIMPLAFAHDFVTLQTLDLEKAPPVVANLVRNAALDQREAAKDGDFYFACEISAELVSAKKFADPADLTVKIDQDDEKATIAIALPKSKLDQYPLSYKELCDRVKTKIPSIKPAKINEVIKQFKLKENPKLAAYSFRTKAQEEVFRSTGAVPKGTTSIYNEDAVRFIAEKVTSSKKAAS